MSDSYHVIPVEDLIEHDSSGEADCICGLGTEPVKRDDGSMAWLIPPLPEFHEAAT